MTHNHYIKKLSASKINDLINYVFPNIEPAMLTDRDDRLSLFTVYYDMADATLHVMIDDFEGISGTPAPTQLTESPAYMDGQQQIRFYAWMYHVFREPYLKDLARYLGKRYSKQ